MNLMKINIAKIFCFLTVLLLSSNVVLSSLPVDYKIQRIKLHKKSNTDELQISQSNIEGSQLSFLAEQDPFEDNDILADLPPTSFQIVFCGNFYIEGNHSAYKTYFYKGLKIPRWLWTRQIII